MGASDFDEDAPTHVTAAGALPELEVAENDIVTPQRTLCAGCLRPVKTGGDTLPSWEAMTENAPDTCWVSLKGVWWYCSGRKPKMLVLTG